MREVNEQGIRFGTSAVSCGIVPVNTKIECAGSSTNNSGGDGVSTCAADDLEITGDKSSIRTKFEEITSAPAPPKMAFVPETLKPLLALKLMVS